MQKLLHILFIFLFLSQLRSAAQQAIPITVSGKAWQVYDLGPAAAVMEDPQHQLAIADFSQPAIKARFVPLQSFAGPIRTNTAYWIAIPVQVLDSLHNWKVLLRREKDIYYNENSYTDVYLVSRSGTMEQHKRTGLFLPRSQKSIATDPGINQVLISAGPGLHMLYIRTSYTFYAEGKLPVPELRHTQVPVPNAPYSRMFSVLFTIALLFAMLSFFFYFFVREKAYLLFGLYTLVLSQHYLILHPEALFIDWYIPENPHWSIPFFSFLAPGSFALFLWFGDALVNLEKLSARVHRTLLWVIASYGILLLLDGIAMGITQRLLLSPYLTYAGAMIMLGFVVRMAFFRTVLVRFYVAGALWLCVFTILGILQNKGVVSLPFVAWPVGQVGQLIIYAAGLAYKIRLNEKARAEASRIREMDEIKSTFFANISHEFRTPLTLIRGTLQQMEGSALPATQEKDTFLVPQRQLQVIRRNTDRLLELVNQLLDLSRLDSGKMKLQVIKGDLVQLLRSLVASFDSMAVRKNIHYRVHFPDQTHIAFFDKDKLEKIVVNLVSNAFKYTPEKGTVSVIVELEPNRLCVTVEDNGPGIARKELDKVFDRFYQAAGTDDGGSGIGLALVKELVELYRGQISVVSEPGKGSRFRVSLPCDKPAFTDDELVYGEWKNEESDTPRNAPDIIIQPATRDHNPGLPMLLIVEDNKDLRNFIREIVQDRYNVSEAVNGKEGLDKVFAEVPDIIVSDVMMPGMDGFELTGRIKKDERSSHIPVILLTAKAGIRHRVEGLQTGADDYLTKPFDAEELMARLQNLINQRKLLRKKFAAAISVKPSEITVRSIDEQFLSNLMSLIEKNLDDDSFGVEDLARKAAMSRSQLHRKLVALLDKSPSDLIRQTRLLRARDLLQRKAFSPSEVAFKVGFNSHSYFSKCFKDEFGVSPGEIE